MNVNKPLNSAHSILSDDLLFKNIYMKSNGLYDKNRYIEFKLLPFQYWFFKLCNSITNNYSVAKIDLKEAQNIANIISDQFKTPVKVVKSLKINPYTSDLVYPKKMNEECKLKEGVKDDDVYTTSAFIIHDLKKIDGILNFFLSQGFLTEPDIKNMNPDLSIIKEHVKQESYLTPTISNTQKIAFSNHASPHIVKIAIMCHDLPRTEAALGNLYRSFEGSVTKRDLAFALLIDICQKPLNTVFIELCPGLKNCFDSATVLQALYLGRMDALSLFPHANPFFLPAIPELKSQRKFLLELFECNINEIFEKEGLFPIDTKEDFAVVNMRKELFSAGMQLNALHYFSESTRISHKQAALDCLNQNYLIESPEGIKKLKYVWENEISPEEAQILIQDIKKDIESDWMTKCINDSIYAQDGVIN